LPFKVHKITYADTNSFSKTVIDYLREADTIQPFYKYKVDIDTFAEVIKDKQNQQIDRTALVNCLQVQYNSIESSNAVQANITALQDSNTFTVCTAHQLNLFTGPLYVIFKIVATINLCEQLKDKYPSYNFVPVYWMGGEDHDFEEVNHCNLYSKTVTWQKNEKGAVGRFSLNGIENAINELKEILGDSDSAVGLLKEIKNHFANKSSYAEACLSYLNYLFSYKGLVIVNADHKNLKSLFKHVLIDELENETAYNVLANNIEAFEKLYKVQAKPRNINLFYLDKQVRGLIEKQGEYYTVRDTDLKFTKEEILKLAKTEPEKFSPNVILRPLYQETVLPNLANVGGGGELAYWLELKPLFEKFSVNYPMVILRTSAAFIDGKSMKKWSNIELNEIDLFKEEHILSESIIHQNKESDIEFDEEITLLQNLKKSLIEKASKIDNSLSQPIEGEFTKMEKGLNNLQQKFLRAVKRNNETLLSAIPKVQNKLKPNGKLQERYLNYLQFRLKYGDEFMKVLFENLNPLEKRFLLFEELDN